MRALSFTALLLSLSLAGCAGAPVSTAPKPDTPPNQAAPAEAIPPLDHAPLVRAKAATHMMPDELILGVELGGDARAYPLRFLEGHGVANDTINGIPVALAYCRPCGSAVLYRTDTPKGTLTLALSGRSRDGDPLLVDRQTGTLWRPLTGTPVEGPLAGSGIELQPLPVVLTSWKRWFESRLETRVLAGSGSEDKPAAGSGGDPAAPGVFGLVLGGAARAYPVDLVAKQGVINDELGGRPVVIVAEPGADPANRTIRAFERGDRTFTRGHALLGADFLNDQNGHPWKIGEESLTAPDGRQLLRLPGRLAAPAAWSAAYPRGQVYGVP
ncbi:MAG TPA: DUF3179 domain-containing (seleno)protein [Thermoanaerobaculia bacterium]|nr:DUF3179 domain-containing (seleno)protein [Thermoanaerobaculia bacterium]